MPLYTYECEKCNKIFNINQKMTDKKFHTCAQVSDCHKEGLLKRLIGIPNIKFNGNGFYITDYKNNKKDSK